MMHNNIIWAFYLFILLVYCVFVRMRVCLPVYDLCLKFVNFVRACMAHQSPIVSFIARYSTMHGRFSSPVGRNIQRCEQRYASTVEDLLLRGPVRNVVASKA